MNALTLFIGSKNRSSWSLRPWLFLKHHGVPFKEVLIALDQPDTRDRIRVHSPSGRVPALLRGAVRVWESLAICEYVAETCALPCAWPLDPAARAYARSAALEMHAGFADLRRELPFDATREPAPTPVSAAASADIERVCAIWSEARSRFGWNGDWLFGSFGIADAMFAPVALRFAVYDVKLGRTESDYVQRMLAHPAVRQWIEAAALEAQRAVSAPTIAKTARLPAIVPGPEPGSAMPSAETVSISAPVAAAADDIGEDEMPPAPQRRPAKAADASKSPRKEPEPAKPSHVRSTILPPD